MRILITGSDGQLGRSLQRSYSGHDVAALTHTALDVRSPDAVDHAIGDCRPDLVIHTAAMTDTARCELEPDQARAVNSIGAQNVATASHRVGARLVAISTNEVFDGAKREPYLEDDAIGPLNTYARSKLEGERLAVAACPDALIVRTSWLYGDGGRNFVGKIRTAATSPTRLSVVVDEIAAPTSSTELADAIRALVEHRAPAGIYHLANSGEASRYDWAVEILRLSGMSAVPIEAVTMEQLRAIGYSGPRKPAYSVLANTRAAALGVTLGAWQEALVRHFERSQIAADA